MPVSYRKVPLVKSGLRERLRSVTRVFYNPEVPGHTPALWVSHPEAELPEDGQRPGCQAQERAQNAHQSSTLQGSAGKPSPSPL